MSKLIREDVERGTFNGQEGEFYSLYEWVENRCGFPGYYSFEGRYFRADKPPTERMTDDEWTRQYDGYGY